VWKTSYRQEARSHEPCTKSHVRHWTNPQALEQIGNVRRLTDTIARTLARPSDSGFDRIRAGELASMLADVLQRASESLRRDGSDPTLAVRVERARQESAELRDAISRRDVLPAVVRAYQQWKQVWTRLAAYAEQLPESPKALDEARRVRIRSLDQQLQAELVVSPGGDGLPAKASLTSDLVATAEFLARVLREEAADGDAVLRADEFALAARDFHRSFIEGQSRVIASLPAWAIARGTIGHNQDDFRGAAVVQASHRRPRQFARARCHSVLECTGKAPGTNGPGFGIEFASRWPVTVVVVSSGCGRNHSSAKPSSC
jgi:hypothetical protein